MKQMLRISFYILLVFFIYACSISDETDNNIPDIDITPLHLDDGWQISLPEAQGFNLEDLKIAYKEASTFTFIYSTLIIRNGYLVAEKYFNGAGVHQAKYIASATKSYLSALIGIAKDKGYIKDLNQKMMSFFPEYASENIEPDKYEITIKHLLQMRAGYWHDSTDDRWWAWINSPDWIKYMIDLPLENPPDKAWNYSTGSSQILSGILTKSTGKTGVDFAVKYLFDPINSGLASWAKDPQGYNQGGFNMYITPRDMARLGLLYLNNGEFNSTQIVSQNWVMESTKPYSRVKWEFGPIINASYGYHWWTGEIKGYPIFFATGHGGQNIMIFRDLNMVVVTTTNADIGFADSWHQSLATFYFIANHILPAIIE